MMMTAAEGMTGSVADHTTAWPGLHSYFARRHQPQQLDQQTYIRLNTYNRLTPAQHFILDVTA